MKAIITGATGGLGKSLVYECAKRGYDLVLSATNQNRLDALKQEINSRYPNISVVAKECNLADENSRKTFYEFVESLETKPNILINNAGYIVEGSVLGTTNEEINSCINVNISGTTNLAYWFLTNREKSVKNYCLFVSSLASYYPMPQMATYGASKSYLTHLSVSLRKELKKEKVNVSCICPGGMATNEAMKRSLKSQGVSGKLSSISTDKVAKIGIKKLLKNKAIWVPGIFNKFMILFAKILPKRVIASFVGNRWTNCEKKRGEYR